MVHSLVCLGYTTVFMLKILDIYWYRYLVFKLL